MRVCEPHPLEGRALIGLSLMRWGSWKPYEVLLVVVGGAGGWSLLLAVVEAV